MYSKCCKLKFIYLLVKKRLLLSTLLEETHTHDKYTNLDTLKVLADF